MSNLSVRLLFCSIVFSILLIDHVKGYRMRNSRLFMSSSTQQHKKTIVVTGLGIISPSGNTVSEFFNNLIEGKTAIDKVDRFDATKYPCKIAAQVRNFDPNNHYIGKKKVRQNDLSCHYAVAAAHQALADANINLLSTTTVDPNRVGVIVGSAFGGMETFEQTAKNLEKGGINPYTIPMILGNIPAGIIAMETGAKGPNFAVQTACATATHAMGEVSNYILIVSSSYIFEFLSMYIYILYTY